MHCGHLLPFEVVSLPNFSLQARGYQLWLAPKSLPKFSEKEKGQSNWENWQSQNTCFYASTLRSIFYSHQDFPSPSRFLWDMHVNWFSCLLYLAFGSKGWSIFLNKCSDLVILLLYNFQLFIVWRHSFFFIFYPKHFLWHSRFESFSQGLNHLALMVWLIFHNKL